MTEFDDRQPPDQEQPLHAGTVLLQMLGRNSLHAYNKALERLSLAPERPPTIYRTMEEDLAHSPQPLQPELFTVADNIRVVVEKHAAVLPNSSLTLSGKTTQSMRLVQFTDQFASSGQTFLDYHDMKELKDRFATLAEEQAHPLSFDQQLDIALEISGSDITKALNNLCFTSRQYSRWLDSISIRDLPSLTAEDVLTEMKEWRGSILACKNADAKNFQDTAGDNYYAWTHALSRVMYGSGTSPTDQIGKYIFSRGTEIMHTGVHTFTKQSVPSDHRVAATYGNRIGDAILSSVEPTSHHRPPTIFPIPALIAMLNARHQILGDNPPRHRSRQTHAPYDSHIVSDDADRSQ